MPIFHLNSLPKEKRIQLIAEFYDTIDSLKDRNEIRFFFKSLLTAEEIASLMRRIEIAVLLSAGFGYNKIIKMLGVGRDKISAVQKNLQQDDNGYKIIVDRLIEIRKERLKKNGIKPEMGIANSMRKTHPLYFAPFLPSILDLAIDGGKSELDFDESLKRKAIYSTPSLQTEVKSKKIKK
jgi:TrpR-related protein YerC/YecD